MTDVTGVAIRIFAGQSAAPPAAAKYGYPKDYTYPYSELLKIAQQFKEEWGLK